MWVWLHAGYDLWAWLHNASLQRLFTTPCSKILSLIHTKPDLNTHSIGAYRCACPGLWVFAGCARQGLAQQPRSSCAKQGIGAPSVCSHLRTWLRHSRRWVDGLPLGSWHVFLSSGATDTTPLILHRDLQFGVKVGRPQYLVDAPGADGAGSAAAMKP
jgi:hypothetical protein